MQTLLTRTLHRHLALFPEQLPPEASEADEDAYRTQRRARLEHHCRLMALAVLAFTLLWWPTDIVVYRGVPDALPAMRLWRTLVAGICGLYLLLPLPRFLRRRPVIPFSVGVVLNAAAMGYTAGLMGGPDRPYIHLLYVMFFGTMLLPLDFLPRVALTTVLAASAILAFLLPFPAYLASPQLPILLSFSLCVLCLSIGFGHLILVLGRENFVQAQRITAQAAALSDHSARLEERVALRTAELRRLLVHLETTREDERARISRELHDELGQELSALRFALGHTKGRYAQEPLGIAPNLAELDMLLARTGAAARALITDLRPRVLDELGLEAAAEWLVRRVEERAGVPCALTIERAEDAPAREEPKGEAATVAFRVLQESLTNVERHAQASRVEVLLRLGKESLELRVTDDGKGLSPGPTAGMGLLGMRERALAAGGAVSVDSRPGQGTTVRLRLPLPARPPAAAVAPARP